MKTFIAQCVLYAVLVDVDWIFYKNQSNATLLNNFSLQSSIISDLGIPWSFAFPLADQFVKMFQQ